MSGVLIIGEHRRGELRPATLELVSAAQSARRTPDERVAVALLASALVPARTPQAHRLTSPTRPAEVTA